MRLDVRLAKTLGMLLAVLFIFWFPVLALMVYSLGARLSDQVKKVFAFCSLLCLVNSMINPIIYALRSGEIRSSAHHRTGAHLCRSCTRIPQVCRTSDKACRHLNSS